MAPGERRLVDLPMSALANRTPRSDAKDGLRVVRVLEAGQRSLEKHGAPVELG